MEEAKSIKEEQEDTSVDSIAVVKEEYERKLNEMQSTYEQRIKDINLNHIKEIRELMREGKQPESVDASEITELSEEEQIFNNLKNKYKIN